MAHRTIGQQGFGFAGRERPRSPLDEIAALVVWAPIAMLLGSLYPAAKGESASSPLAMFKAMLLAVWHDLSDVKLADALDDRASFRRFCGFSGTEATPERTAFVRFRRLLVAHDLASRGIRITTGTIVDATIVASASEEDGDGRWVKHRGKRATHGFKAHVGCDADTALVERIAITPANMNDGRAGPDALPDDPGEVFADSAYRGPHFAGAVRARGGPPRGVLNALGGRDEQETLGRLRDWNRPIHRVRGRIEKIFGTWKRSYGLRRMRWRGLPKAAVQVHLTAIAYNLKRTFNILTNPA